MIAWDRTPDGLWLMTSAEMDQLADSAQIESISGKKITRGQLVDQDIRGGYLAWGVRDPLNHEHKQLLLTLILKGH